jgi:hypothetical protein
MASTPGTKPNPGKAKHMRYPAGQRLHCTKCGSEIEILNPCVCDPPDMVLQCCNRDMQPQTGQNVHVSSE